MHSTIFLKFPFSDFQIHRLLKTLKYAIFGQKSPKMAHETAEIAKNRHLVGILIIITPFGSKWSIFAENQNFREALCSKRVDCEVLHNVPLCLYLSTLNSKLSLIIELVKKLVLYCTHGKLFYSQKYHKLNRTFFRELKELHTLHCRILSAIHFN